MRHEKKIVKTIREIYKQMYKETNPSVNIDDLEKQADNLKRDWYMDYYLDMDRQCEIIDKYCKKNKLTKRDSQIVSECVHVGCGGHFGYSPNSSYETWKERRVI
jgi:hypothetical protein